MRFSGLGWALCPVLFCQTIGLARAQNGAAGPKDALGWFERASEQMNLRALGSAPFHMKVRFHALPGVELLPKKKSEIIVGDGEYEETWVSPVSYTHLLGLQKALALAGGLAGLAPFLIGCRTSDFPQYPANYREYAYVTNAQSGTLTVLDAVNLRLDREIPVGQNPVAVAVSPTRNEVYVVNAGVESGMGSITVIDAENNSVVTNIPVLLAPVSIEVEPNGRLAWVANSGSNAISVIDLANRREIARIGTGKEPVEARLSPDGQTLVVANRGDGSASVFDSPAGRLRARCV